MQPSLTGEQKHTADSLLHQYKTGVALLFSGVFHLLALLLVGLSFSTFFNGLFSSDGDMVTLVIKAINTLVIALAMYELGLGLVRNTRRKKPGKIFSRISAALLPVLWAPCALLWYWKR